MLNSWDMLTKELAIYGVKLANTRECSIYDGEKYIKTNIDKTIGSIKKRMINNGKEFEEEFQDLLIILQQEQPYGTKDPLDELSLKLFIHSLKDLYDFVLFVCGNFFFDNEKLQTVLPQVVKDALNKDYTQFSKETILNLLDNKIILDWIFRQLSLLAYIKSLLQFAKFGPTRLSKITVKTARGISGPWANLDLPMLERKYPWHDIVEEIRGRERDKKRQRRYRKGFNYYNDPYGHAGEGHYWREMRNEPFSWSQRTTESPYPSRNLLME